MLGCATLLGDVPQWLMRHTHSTGSSRSPTSCSCCGQPEGLEQEGEKNAWGSGSCPNKTEATTRDRAALYPTWPRRLMSNAPDSKGFDSMTM